MSDDNPYYVAPSPAQPPAGYPMPPPQQSLPPGWAPPAVPGPPPPKIGSYTPNRSRTLPYVIVGILVLGALSGMILMATTFATGTKKVVEVPARVFALQTQLVLRDAARSEEVVRAQTDNYTSDLTVLKANGLDYDPSITVAVIYATPVNFCISAKHPRSPLTWYVSSVNTTPTNQPCG